MVTTATPIKAERIPALDFTKGTLVLFMVLYHWVNYFIGLQWPYYRYLRFLSPAFIFVSGYMISRVSLAKYESANTKLSRRLLTRGLKLIVVFVALNIARDVVLPRLSSAIPTMEQVNIHTLFTIFGTGNVSDRLVSFSILVPIAYLLILSSLLVRSFRNYKRTFLCVSLALLVLALSLYLIGVEVVNLEIITIGMLGVAVGFAPAETTDQLTRHPLLIMVAYLLYATAITMWNVPFPLEIVGVFLTVTLIYFVGTGDGKRGTLRSEIDMLGRYSLFGYISQIVVLQILEASLKRFNSGTLILLVSFCAAYVLTVLSVEAVDRARTASIGVDRLYRFIFN